MNHRLFDLSMVVFHQNYTNKKCLFLVSLSIDHKRGFTTTSVNQKQCESFLSMAWARKIFVHTSHICSACICKTKSNSEKRVTTARLTYPIQHWYKHHRVKINIKMRANCSACKCIAWHRASDREVETLRVMERMVRRKEKYKIESTVKISRRSKYPNHTQTFNSNTMILVAI